MFRMPTAPIIRSTLNCNSLQCGHNMATLEGGGCSNTMTCTNGCSYSLMYSWRWVQLAPETCRVILQKNKLPTVASILILLILNHDARNHDHKMYPISCPNFYEPLPFRLLHLPWDLANIIKKKKRSHPTRLVKNSIGFCWLRLAFVRSIAEYVWWRKEIKFPKHYVWKTQDGQYPKRLLP
jgi:hypothetical protein